jgi:hypothetical protein
MPAEVGEPDVVCQGMSGFSGEFLVLLAMPSPAVPHERTNPPKGKTPPTGTIHAE